MDHNIPTTDRSTFTSIETFITEPNSFTQCVTLEDNVKARASDAELCALAGMLVCNGTVCPP